MEHFLLAHCSDTVGVEAKSGIKLCYDSMRALMQISFSGTDSHEAQNSCYSVIQEIVHLKPVAVNLQTKVQNVSPSCTIKTYEH